MGTFLKMIEDVSFIVSKNWTQNGDFCPNTQFNEYSLMYLLVTVQFALGMSDEKPQTKYIYWMLSRELLLYIAYSEH